MNTPYGNFTDLERVLVGQEMDDFESMSDDAESHELLAVVAALHHQAINHESTTIANCRSEGTNLVNIFFRTECFRRGPSAPVDQSLHDGHLRLFELLLCIASGGVGEEDGVADLDVVLERNILHFNSENRK